MRKQSPATFWFSRNPDSLEANTAIYITEIGTQSFLPYHTMMSRKKGRENMDRLSYLPCHLRNRIVSNLTTIEAIQLSVLSTRWRYPCSSRSQLRFNQFDWYSKKTEDFKNCVDKALISHDNTDIGRFSFVLHIDGKHITNSVLNSWITILLQHNIRDLLLSASSRKDTVFPCSFFNCATLTALRLHDIKLTGMPNVVRFPILKHLGLSRIEFYEEDEADIQNKLFSAATCPVLQSLEVLHCDQIHYLRITIPSLKYLKLFTRNCSQFLVSIPTLEQLVYQGTSLDMETIDICTDTIFSLRSANLDLLFASRLDGLSVCTILRSLHKLHDLRLSSSCIDCLSWVQNFSAVNQILFLNLRYLSLEMYRAKKHVQAIRFLIGSSPKLETLNIYASDSAEEMDTSEGNVAVGGTDMLHHLKRVRIRNFGGSQSERELVGYLFTVASILEELRISFAKGKSGCDQTEIVEDFYSLPRVLQSDVNIVVENK